jgi:sortase A
MSTPSSKKRLSQTEHPSARVVRQKIANLYKKEPDAKAELAEIADQTGHLSKHQRYMQQLSSSGKSLAEIQTSWHAYYVALPDNEKHQVWQEFYAQHAKTPSTHQHSHAQPLPIANPTPTKRKKSSHLHSLGFGVTMGFIAVGLFSFGFFNERFIAPFISPSKQVSSESIIIDPNETKTTNDPKIIIPKINVEIPVVFEEKSIDETAVQTALERGVLHYSGTSQPGEKGNGAIFGHSSNNIFNKGKYKFAFVLLSKLEDGDVFYVQKSGTRYAYRVYKKSVVEPTDVSVLDTQDKIATFSLITCDPPGTSLRRLVVVGEQINPNPRSNVAKKDTVKPPAPDELPSNAPTLWSRFTNWIRS